MKKQIKDIQSRLHELGALQQKTNAADQKIQESAALRLEWVNAELLRFRGRALTDKKSEQQYRELILERGRLQQIVSLTETNKNIK